MIFYTFSDLVYESHHYTGLPLKLTFYRYGEEVGQVSMEDILEELGRCSKNIEGAFDIGGFRRAMVRGATDAFKKITGDQLIGGTTSNNNNNNNNDGDDNNNKNDHPFGYTLAGKRGSLLLKKFTDIFWIRLSQVITQSSQHFFNFQNLSRFFKNKK